MGWAERASENPSGLFDSTTDERKLSRYRVRQWTAFAWPDDLDDFRKDREENLSRFGKVLERSLANKCSNFEPLVKTTRVKRRPQLMFELVVPALDEADAIRKTKYWITRASTTSRRYKRRGRSYSSPIGLDYPLGKAEVKLVD